MHASAMHSTYVVTESCAPREGDPSLTITNTYDGMCQGVAGPREVCLSKPHASAKHCMSCEQLEVLLFLLVCACSQGCAFEADQAISSRHRVNSRWHMLAQWPWLVIQFSGLVGLCRSRFYGIQYTVKVRHLMLRIYVQHTRACHFSVLSCSTPAYVQYCINVLMLLPWFCQCADPNQVLPALLTTVAMACVPALCAFTSSSGLEHSSFCLLHKAPCLSRVCPLLAVSSALHLLAVLRSTQVAPRLFCPCYARLVS
jgi:hypothetical protein